MIAGGGAMSVPNRINTNYAVFFRREGQRFSDCKIKPMGIAAKRGGDKDDIAAVSLRFSTVNDIREDEVWNFISVFQLKFGKFELPSTRSRWVVIHLVILPSFLS